MVAGMAGICLAATESPGQANLPLYTDNLVNGFQNYSWATVNVANTSPVHSGSYSMSVTESTNYQALSIQYPAGLNTAPYSSLTFWINGGSTGGQQENVYGTLAGAGQAGYYLTLGTGWQQFTIPLSTLGVANKTNFTGFYIQGAIYAAQPTFYVDDVQLIAAPAPGQVNLAVDAGQTIRSADARWFGVNTATWDGYLGNASTLPALKAAGMMALRWPGGSTADGYNWATDASGNAKFMNVATNLPGAQVFITANYGTGTASEAAAWVRSMNKTNNCGFRYWEVGNECYGNWETDSHAVQHDPYTYATNAAAYINQMKAVDAAFPIKVGVVVVPGEDSYINNYNHAATNPVTGKVHYGWTPVMLATLNRLGVTPDFLIYHFYPQYTPEPVSTSPPSACDDSDPLLLQIAGTVSSSGYTDWASAAANLRMQITDYLGSTAGSNVELCCTENNSDSSGGGKQLSSLVNGLYLADSLSQLMKTEFNSFLFWDLRNGAGSDGSYDPTLYGWRTEGDFGLITGSASYNPPYYAMKLMQYFVRPGDTVLKASSDYPLLSAYAARKADGALTLLVINKDIAAAFNAQISLTNFSPWANATLQSYGMPQDQAVEFSEASVLQDISTTNFPVTGTNFACSFPPLSLNLFTFAPAAAQLQFPSVSVSNLVLQIEGQAGVPYVIQTSPDLVNWSPVSTNSTPGNGLLLTNVISGTASQQFWRAVWIP